MANLTVQLVAAQVLRDTIDRGRSLDRALGSQMERISPEQRPVLQEIAYGGCRYYFYIDGILTSLLSKPIRTKDRMVHFLLLVGLYQIQFMRTPDHAAVNQTVKALAASKQSWARGLVNGVLREFLRRQKNDVAALTKSLTASQLASFSPYLYQVIGDAWGDLAETIYATSTQRPPLTLRVNLQKTTRQDYLALLGAREIKANATEDSLTGVTLEQPLAVDHLPMFSEGWVSVQDESAQLCTAALQLEPGLRVLDTCAAPGGKSCAILEAEPSVALTAVDLPERVDAISQNLDRIGLQALVHDSGLEDHDQWWDGKPWYRILMDVPCSGTGVIRRHPDILHHREPGDLERFAMQQLDLLNIAWEMLAPGGKLLYVTCSIMPLENDGVIGQFLATVSNALVEAVEGIPGQKTRHGLQRLPGIHQGDGFYFCRLAKL